MSIDIEKKYDVSDTGNLGQLDLSQLDIEIDVAHIDQYPNEQYALLRKRGLGTSDTSVLLGVNPYTTLPELIAEKCRDYLTPEEKAVGDKEAVKKGRDLEPVIIARHSELINKRIIKPTDMYRMKDIPYSKFNYDGVIDKEELSDGKYLYIPDEIKVVTLYGEKHYNPAKAFYRDSTGFGEIPEDYSKSEINSIATKAALYGIPPYYYTQLQKEIWGLKAPYGYLTTYFEKHNELVSFYVWRDDACIAQIAAAEYKAWQKIVQITRDTNRHDVSELLRRFKQEQNKPSIGVTLLGTT